MNLGKSLAMEMKLALWVMVTMLVCSNSKLSKATLSPQQDLELENELKFLNKPPILTYQVNFFLFSLFFSFSCIDFNCVVFDFLTFVFRPRKVTSLIVSTSINNLLSIIHCSKITKFRFIILKIHLRFSVLLINFYSFKSHISLGFKLIKLKVSRLKGKSVNSFFNGKTKLLLVFFSFFLKF